MDFVEVDTTPVLVDHDLLGSLRATLSNRKACVDPNRREELSEKCDEYLTACKLAKGPDAGRGTFQALDE